MRLDPIESQQRSKVTDRLTVVPIRRGDQQTCCPPKLARKVCHLAGNAAPKTVENSDVATVGPAAHGFAKISGYVVALVGSAVTGDMRGGQKFEEVRSIPEGSSRKIRMEVFDNLEIAAPAAKGEVP